MRRLLFSLILVIYTCTSYSQSITDLKGIWFSVPEVHKSDSLNYLMECVNSYLELEIDDNGIISVYESYRVDSIGTISGSDTSSNIFNIDFFPTNKENLKIDDLKIEIIDTNKIIVIITSQDKTIFNKFDWKNFDLVQMEKLKGIEDALEIEKRFLSIWSKNRKFDENLFHKMRNYAIEIPLQSN